MKTLFSSSTLRTKILYTIGALVLYRLVAAWPAPNVNYDNINACVSASATSPLYSLIALFSGGALLQLSILALGVIPYITASIMMQLLQVIVPKLEQLKKEGSAGQAKISQYTRMLTIPLAMLQAAGITALARTPGQLIPGCDQPIVNSTGPAAWVLMISSLTAGAILLMRLGEIVTEKGIGNGMSVLIAASILAGFPTLVYSIKETNGFGMIAIFGAAAVAMIMGVVFVEQAARRIPLIYTRSKAVGTSFASVSSYLPIKVNPSGVIPIIFASSLTYFPVLLYSFFPDSGWAQWANRHLAVGRPWWILLYVGLIIFFSFFYTTILLNPVELSDNLKRDGAYIPGIRAGTPTADYLNYVITRLVAAGGIYLALIATVPTLLIRADLGQGLLGGTSVLIVVGVGLEIIRQYQATRDTEDLGYLLSHPDQVRNPGF